MPFSTRSDGKTIYTTDDGDTVSLIAWLQFGTQKRTSEAILDANPGLAALGEVLQAGVVIVMPDAPPAQPPAQINIWD